MALSHQRLGWVQTAETHPTLCLIEAITHNGIIIGSPSFSRSFVVALSRGPEGARSRIAPLSSNWGCAPDSDGSVFDQGFGA